jgi:TonB family protein
MSMPILPVTLLAWSEQVFVLVAAGALAALAIANPKARLAMWQGLLLLLLLLPAIEPWAVPPPLAAPAATAFIASTAGALTPAPAAVFHWRPEYWLWLIAAGAALRLMWVAAGFLRLQRYRKQARPLAEPPLRFASDVAKWYSSDSVTGPVTYGWRHPVILLPSKALKLPPDLCEAIECHELIHVRRGDWLWVLAETLVRSVLWFHPAVWFVMNRIQLAREQAVDQEAVSLLQNRERYLDALVAVASYQLGAGLGSDVAPAFLRKRHLLARVEAVVKEAEVKEMDMSRSRRLAGVTAACSVLPAAAMAAIWLFPFVTEAQTSPDSPGITVDAGAVLLHRAPVRMPEGSTANGKVVVEATLNAKGEVSDARVISGPEELRKEALASVLQWHYQPGPAVAQIAIQFGSAAAAAPAPAAQPNPVAQPDLGTLRTIEFAGISPEAEQQLRERLPVREGDTVGRQDMAGITSMVRAFDSHLTAAFTVGNGNVTAIRIAPASAGPAIGFAGTPGGRGGAAPAPATSMTPAQLATGAYPAGGGVSNPIPISKPEPEYSEEARKARWGGTVLLSLVIDQNGKPQDIHVLKPLGLGLDEKAIEAVTQWSFKPGMKSGVAVPVAAQIEVTFRPKD